MTLPTTPDTKGESAHVDPNDDSFETENTQPSPETVDTEGYGVEEITTTTTDVKFDNAILQALHEHPVWGTIAFVVFGGIMTGLVVVGVKALKCPKEAIL